MWTTYFVYVYRGFAKNHCHLTSKSPRHRREHPRLLLLWLTLIWRIRGNKNLSGRFCLYDKSTVCFLSSKDYVSFNV